MKFENDRNRDWIVDIEHAITMPSGWADNTVEICTLSSASKKKILQTVRLSRSSCIMSVLSLYDSSFSVSSSAIASSKACNEDGSRYYFIRQTRFIHIQIPLWRASVTNLIIITSQGTYA